MFSILQREISGTLSSLLAYISTGVFLVVSGLVLWLYPDSSVLEFGYAGMQTFFDTAPWIFLLLVPAISMRLLAEENKSGTLELLITRPVTDWDIVMAKYLSSLLLIVFALLPTLIYVYSISALAEPAGNLDFGQIAGSYMGLLLLGAGFAAIGLFASSLSSNQVTGFILAVVLCYFFFSGFDSLSRLPALASLDFLPLAGIQAHYLSMSRGVIDSRDVLYFAALISVFLYLTKMRLEARKW